jgi:transcriptional regulator with XRE-family HTH domain
MDETFDDLFGSVEKSPSYWMQVALLEFLQSLDAMRASKGDLSRKELAKRVGVSAATLSRWLNGTENITVSTMCRLASVMDAAVHIHVADQDEKGRWRPELGMARSEKRNATQGPPSTAADFSAFKARREAQALGTVHVTSGSETPSRPGVTLMAQPRVHAETVPAGTSREEIRMTVVPSQGANHG